MQTSVTQVYLQVTKRVQPKLAKGNDCVSVSYTHKVRITERVPQHPKNRRKDSSDKARHRLKNVAAWQLLNKGRAAWCVPCAGAFASFARQKKGTDCEVNPKWLQPKIKGKTDWILKINHVIYVTIKQYWCKVDSGIYRQFLLSVFMQTLRSFCADRKNQRALRMDAFIRQTKLMVFGTAELVRPSAVLYTLPVWTQTVLVFFLKPLTPFA